MKNEAYSEHPREGKDRAEQDTCDPPRAHDRHHERSLNNEPQKIRGQKVL